MSEKPLECAFAYYLTTSQNEIDELFSKREQLKDEKSHLLKMLNPAISKNNNAIYERYLRCCEQIDRLEQILLSKGCVLSMPVL